MESDQRWQMEDWDILDAEVLEKDLTTSLQQLANFKWLIFGEINFHLYCLHIQYMAGSNLSQ